VCKENYIISKKITKDFTYVRTYFKLTHLCENIIMIFREADLIYDEQLDMGYFNI